MQIDLRDVIASPNECLPIDYIIDLSGEEINFDFPFKQPIHVAGTLKNKSEVYYLDVDAVIQIDTTCGRCGNAAHKTKTQPISLVLAQSVSGDGSDDIIVVGGEKFDLDEIIREEIILDTDMVTLCDENCKGLCPKCGQNLNEKDCGCTTSEIDPRLAKLTQLLQDI